jgi:hypothetical protein
LLTRPFFLLLSLSVVGAFSRAADPMRMVPLSARSDMVSGGDVLVRVDVPADLLLGDVVVERDGIDVSGAFRPAASGHALVGLVGGLRLGDNNLTARPKGRPAPSATVLVTNHPISGPILSGPHEQPFFCTTHLFRMVNGESLGPSTGADCWVPRRVDYVYRSTAGEISALPDPRARPADLAYTTTLDGRRTPYIVRVETGVINRAIYEIAMLHDPTGPVPDPWTTNPAWNGRLLYRFGGGCREGWYTQGTGTGGALDDVQLSRGYAIASASLNVFGNNCNELLAAETMMMVKERFIEAYGPPRYTIGWGSSGGSHQQHAIGDVYPGLLDGLIVGRSFPDVTSSTIFKLMDGRLLEHYFGEIAPGRFTEEQQRAISGFGVHASIKNQSEGAARLDADAEFADEVPVEARYDAVKNPGGARGDVYDHDVNIYGRDPLTGFARRPLDNVGIQYGLAALNASTITVADFLDLNERIGGLDDDGDFQPQRTVADLAATREAYRSGRVTWGGGGLAETPIIDFRPYVDQVGAGDNHMRVHSFQLRERLIRANGHADNQVMLVRDSLWGFGFGARFSSTEGNDVLYEALQQMDDWLANLAADTSGDPKAVKVVRAKPVGLVDACWTEDGRKISEPQTFAGAGRCNELYPAFPLPRMVAGGPLTDDLVKCQLRPIDAGDYAVRLTGEERSRLGRIFPDGVCDWSKPGVEQQPSVPWYRVGS